MGPGREQGVELLRSRGVWVLVSPRVDQMRRSQLRGGAPSSREPALQTSEDRSVGCAPPLTHLGELSAWQPPCDEHRGGAQSPAGKAALPRALSRTTHAQSPSSRSPWPALSPEPGNRRPWGLVATGDLEAV